MTNCYVTCFLLTFLVPFSTCADIEDTIRDKKLISTFQVVRFPNDACTGSNTRNGTCYTSQECTNKGGSSAGSCADGFGVCCTFLISTCGSSSSENLTSWTQPTAGVVTTDCTLSVMPVSDDICSLRIDFTTFVITGPNTLSIVGVRRRLGNPIENHADAYILEGSNYATNCLFDSFYATGASPSTNPPVVCGTLTGQHMYVEADTDRGNEFTFQFADSAIAATVVSIQRGVTALATRTWDMTITHIECSSATVPPTGCTKYYWNAAGRAQLENYNYSAAEDATSIHLGQQHERMCIRRERSFCVGCFSAVTTDFDVSFNGPNVAHYTVPNGCCGYTSVESVLAPVTAADNVKLGNGSAGDSQFGWDCIIIPGAFTTGTDAIGTVDATPTAAELAQVLAASPSAAHMNMPSGPQICGTGGGIGAGAAIMTSSTDDNTNGAIIGAGSAVSHSVCTRIAPFTLEFMSDDLEGLGITAGDSEFTTVTYNQGFSILHTQLAC